MHISPVKSLCLLSLLVGGCQYVGQKDYRAEKERAERLTAQNEQLVGKNQALQQEVEQLSSQLAVLQGMPADRVARLVRVAKIQMGRFSLGYDEDEDGRDDGIKVYLVLRDHDHDRIKGAGRVEIEFWDLAAGQEQHRLGSWQFGLEQVNTRWFGGMMADHYRFKLAWPEGARPQHSEITVKCRYEDALTGLSFEAQKVVSVSLAGGGP